MSKKKLLIVSLGRKALEEHTKNMILYFPNDDFDLIHSSYSETDYRTVNIAFITKTYQSKLTFLINSIIILPFFLLRLLKIHHQYDIIYFPTVHPWNLAIIILWKFLKKKTILTIHDAELHPGEENLILQLCLTYSMKFTTHLLFLTKFVQEKAYKKNKLNQPYKIIGQGLLPLPNIQLHTGRKAKNILFLGRISKYKGVDLLVEAVNELSPSSYDSLTIAGMVINEIKVPKDNPKITLFSKYMTEEEMAHFLNTSDILVLPYIEASQSGVVLLAILAEKPIICTKVGGLTEQLTDGECLFITPNKNDIKDAIEHLLGDDVLYNSMQMALRKKKKDLSWEHKTNALIIYANEIRSNKI